MTEDTKKSVLDDMNMDDETPLDLKGSKQHHDLKNNPGDAGKTEHASAPASDEVAEVVKDALSENSDETSVSSALKKAIDG